MVNSLYKFRHGTREKQSLQESVTVRHDCRMEDKLDKYGWDRHNGISFGVCACLRACACSRAAGLNATLARDPQ